MPVAIKRRMVGESPGVAEVARPATIPMRNEPTRFTASVPQGKPGPKRWRVKATVAQRRTDPIAPPRATQNAACQLIWAALRFTEARPYATLSPWNGPSVRFLYVFRR